MKKLLNYAWQIVAAILFILLILSRECSPKQKPCPEYKDSTSTIIKHDTILITGKTVYKPVPYEVIKIDTVLKNADTAEILRDWNYARNYKLSIADSNAQIDVLADVRYNQLMKWSYTGKTFPKTITIYKEHTTIVPIKNKLYVGIGLGGWIDKFGAEASVGLNTKKDHLYTISYDPINTYARINMFWKIHIK